MKKGLIFGGIALAGFGFYRYFKYQMDMALNYDYKIKNFKIIKVGTTDVTAELEIEITNNSAFQVEVKGYDLKLFFKGQNFANAVSNKSFLVYPNNSFTLKTTGVINLGQAKLAVLPFVQDVLSKKPINVEVVGSAKVKFLGVNYTFNFDKQSFEYSADLLKEYGLNEKVNTFKKNNPKIAQFLGIK
jgi:LEA14-like dessication related protein